MGGFSDFSITKIISTGVDSMNTKNNKKAYKKQTPDLPSVIGNYSDFLAQSREINGSLGFSGYTTCARTNNN
jgi:hypothetical protein